MLFEINIKDPKGRSMLQDVFHMESITTFMNLSFVLSEAFQEVDGNYGYTISVHSHRGLHVFYRLASIQEVIEYKNALYDELIQLAAS